MGATTSESSQPSGSSRNPRWGAIRDHLIGLPITDLDVFILGMSAQAAHETFNAEIVEYAGVEEAKHRYEEQDGLCVDLVFSQYDNVHDVLDHFDLGICRIAWDGWKYVITDEFKRDFAQKQISTFFPSPSGHRDRVLAKLKPVGFTLGDDVHAREYVRDLAARRGYRLMHRRNGEYWLMPNKPMSLEDVLHALG